MACLACLADSIAPEVGAVAPLDRRALGQHDLKQPPHRNQLGVEVGEDLERQDRVRRGSGGEDAHSDPPSDPPAPIRESTPSDGLTAGVPPKDGSLTRAGSIACATC